MRSKLKPSSVAALSACVIGLACSTHANASFIVGSENPGGDGWDIQHSFSANIISSRLPPNPDNVFERTTEGKLTIDFPISDPTTTYDFKFSEGILQRGVDPINGIGLTGTGLRTSSMIFTIDNPTSSRFNITGLHFTLIDSPDFCGKVLCVTGIANIAHPDLAHFHPNNVAAFTSTVAGGSTTAGGIVSTSNDASNYFYTLNISNTSLSPGQNLELQGGPSFGIHQYEVKNLDVDRSFILRITADSVPLVDPNTVPLPGTLALFSAGLLGLAFLRKKI